MRDQDGEIGRPPRGTAAFGVTDRLMQDDVARVAQLVEHTLGKGEVIGSIPIASLEADDYALRAAR
jgi:hypothetical protein